MPRRNAVLALAGAAAGISAGVVAERLVVKRRRTVDPEAGEQFGTRRGDRQRMLDLPDGARLFVEESGPESPRGVVFIHGSALRTDLWHYQMEIEDRRLIFYDLRGHGLSQPKGDAEYSVGTLAEDLAAVIEDAGLEEVVLVGHSVGGMVGLQLCSTLPEWCGSRIKGLVLAHSTYRPPIETIVGGATVAKLERALRRPLDALGGQHRRIDQLRRIVRPSDAVFWGVAFTAFGPHASAKQIDFTYDMVAETPSDVVFDLFKAYRGFDVVDKLGDITVPTLVITGKHDRITVPEASEHLAEHLPKAELVLLEDCGHMSMLEMHDEFNAMLESFLADNLAE